MKRAKLTLAIVATLAIVGGTFAVKASKFTGIRYYTTSTPNGIPPAGNTFIGKTVSGTASVYYTNEVNKAATGYSQVAVDAL